MAGGGSRRLTNGTVLAPVKDDLCDAVVGADRDLLGKDEKEGDLGGLSLRCIYLWRAVGWLRRTHGCSGGCSGEDWTEGSEGRDELLRLSPDDAVRKS